MELDEAIRYYYHQLPGFSFRFFQEVEASIDRMKLMFEAWTKIGDQKRRGLRALNQRSSQKEAKVVRSEGSTGKNANTEAA